jgi:hypothetical protein
MIPGEMLPNEDREITTFTFANLDDRPVQVGSHCHFFETNKSLKYDRETSLRHAPGHPGRDERALRARRQTRGRPRRYRGTQDRKRLERQAPHGLLAGAPGTLASASAVAPGLCVVHILTDKAPELYGTLNGVRRIARSSLSLPESVREVA